jgi:protein-S-isoprenylcysteine O-methyltransferase Ste14
MSKFTRRVLTSFAVPCVFMLGFPITATLLHDTNRIAWLTGVPQKSIATIFGIILLISGLLLVWRTVPLFLKLSEGTIMPWEPAKVLIVEGVYRYVRNPMHIGVFMVMFGEGLILRSIFILTFAAFATVSHLFYIPFMEERGLDERFSEEYCVYKANVPRWIPRLTPWKPEG